jgi:LysM repeat protein
MNDNFHDSDSESVAEEKYEEPVDDRRGKNKISTNEQLVYAVIGAALMVVVILIGWFVLQKKSITNTNLIIRLETRIKQFENRLAKIDEIDEQLIQLETTIDRFDRFETSMSLRLDALTRQMASLQNKAITIKEADAAAPKTTSKKSSDAKIHYHMVQAGETLYKISRRYGQTVEELRRSNKLETNSTIYPGQKLIISPGKKEDG